MKFRFWRKPEYIIIYLYADGLIEANERYKKKLEDCLALDDLIRKGWRIMSMGSAMAGSRGLYWCMCVVVR